MMDHGYFDGPFRGGHCRSGKPYIFSQEWRDHLKRTAKTLGCEFVERTPLSDEVGQIAIIPDAKLPFDLRIVRQGICVAKVYGVDAQPDWDTANKIAAALTAHQPLSDEVERVSAIIAFNRNRSNFEIAQRICAALTACRMGGTDE